MKTKTIAVWFLAVSALISSSSANCNPIIIAPNSKVEDVLKPYLVSLSTKSISDFLTILSDSPTLPDLPGSAYKPHEPAPPPSELVDILTKIETAAFGRAGHFRLILADNYGFSPAMMDLENKTIRFDRSYIKHIYSSLNAPEATVSMIMAHEISHFIQELHIQKYSANRKSMNGLPSDAFDLDMREKQGDTFFGISAVAHAEVDLIGAVILQRMGFTKQQIIQAQKIGLEISESDEIQLAPYLNSLNTISVGLKTPVSKAFFPTKPNSIDVANFVARLASLIRINVLERSL